MNFVSPLLLIALLAVIQLMIGGTRLVYSFPAYAIAALAAVLSLRLFRRPSVQPYAVCLSSAVLFAGYILVRGWASPHPFLARADLFLAAACLVVYLLSGLFVVSAPARMGVVYALVGIAVVHVCVGTLQFTGSDHFMLFGSQSAALYGARATGMLENPNYLAVFLNAVALFLASFLLWGRREIPAKMFLAYLLLTCLFGLGITGSRGGYLSLVAGVLVFGGVSLWGLRYCRPASFSMAALGLLMALFLLIAGGLCAMQQSSMISQRLVQVGAVSEDARRFQWHSTLDQFRLAPVFGTGAGTHLLYGHSFRRPQIQSDPLHARNDYLELLAEYGGVGGALAAFFLLAHLGCGLFAVRTMTVERLTNMFGPARSDTLALTLGAMGAAATLLAHSVVDSNMHLPGNALLFAFVFGILASPGIPPSPETPNSRTELGARGLLGFVGGILLFVLLWQCPAEWALERVTQALDSNQYKETLQRAALAIQKAPSDPAPYYQQGEAFRALAASVPGDAAQESYYRAAIAAYHKGLQRFPEDAKAWLRLGQCLDGVRELDGAEEAYNRAVALDPTLGVLYAYYAEYLELVGDPEGVKRCRETAEALAAAPSRRIGTNEPPSLLQEDIRHGLPVPRSGEAPVKPVQSTDLP